MPPQKSQKQSGDVSASYKQIHQEGSLRTSLQTALSGLIELQLEVKQHCNCATASY